jgi:uncharacterized cupin superfamily protein
MADPTAQRHPHVINIGEVDATHSERGDLVCEIRRLGSRAGASAFGCTHMEVPPGKTAFPFHYHSAFEEALYILDGTAEVRIGDAMIAVRAGDFIALPPGPTTAHALTNRGTTPVRYLAMSAPAVPMTLDIVGYPDSKKLSFAAGVQPGTQGWKDRAWVFKLIREDQPAVDYYDGEPLANPRK